MRSSHGLYSSGGFTRHEQLVKCGNLWTVGVLYSVFTVRYNIIIIQPGQFNVNCMI